MGWGVGSEDGVAVSMVGWGGVGWGGCEVGKGSNSPNGIVHGLIRGVACGMV